MLNPNALLIEQAKIVQALSPITPSSSTPDYVSMKGYEKLTAIISVNNATTVTGSAITLKQATSVGAGGEKPLAFTKMYANTDISASDALVETAVTSDTFTTAATDNLDTLYVIEVKADDLDINGGFDCVRVGTGNATAAVLSVVYILWPAKYGKSTPPTAITD